MTLKKILSYFIYLSIFFIALSILVPKQNIYYAFEKELKKYQFVISNESIKEKFNSLNINDLELYFKSKNIGSVKNSTVAVYFIHNEIDINTFEIKIDKNTYLFNNINLKHTLLSPLNITIEIMNNNIINKGQIDLLSREIVFENINLTDQIKEMFLQLNFSYKNGVYSYEY